MTQQVVDDYIQNKYNQVVDDYIQNKYNKEWNMAALKGRWRWFCTEIEFILCIDLSKIK